MNIEYWEDKVDVWISNLIKLRRGDDTIQSKKKKKEIT